MMQFFEVPVGGRIINTASNFFQYIEAGNAGYNGAIRVRGDGQDYGVYLPGDILRPPRVVRLWEVECVVLGQTATVRVGMGNVWTNASIGAVSLLNKVSPEIKQISQVLAMSAGDGGASLQIIAPNASQEGIVVRHAAVRAYNPPAALGELYVGLVAAETAFVTQTGGTSPGVIPATKGYNLAFLVLQPGQRGIDQRDVEPFQLPPGWGLWFVIQGDDAIQESSYSLSYEAPAPVVVPGGGA
jgi:hypothetical protein